MVAKKVMERVLTRLKVSRKQPSKAKEASPRHEGPTERPFTRVQSTSLPTETISTRKYCGGRFSGGKSPREAAHIVSVDLRKRAHLMALVLGGASSDHGGKGASFRSVRESSKTDECLAGS